MFLVLFCCTLEDGIDLDSFLNFEQWQLRWSYKKGKEGMPLIEILRRISLYFILSSHDVVNCFSVSTCTAVTAVSQWSVYVHAAWPSVCHGDRVILLVIISLSLLIHSSFMITSKFLFRALSNFSLNQAFILFLIVLSYFLIALETMQFRSFMSLCPKKSLFWDYDCSLL